MTKIQTFSSTEEMEQVIKEKTGLIFENFMSFSTYSVLNNDIHQYHLHNHILEVVCTLEDGCEYTLYQTDIYQDLKLPQTEILHENIS